jgi:hypothetical protein
MVARIDGLARSIGDLQDVVGPIKARDPSLKATADRHQHQRYCRPVTPGLLRPTALAFPAGMNNPRRSRRRSAPNAPVPNRREDPDRVVELLNNETTTRSSQVGFY